MARFTAAMVSDAFDARDGAKVAQAVSRCITKLMNYGFMNIHTITNPNDGTDEQHAAPLNGLGTPQRRTTQSGKQARRVWVFKGELPSASEQDEARGLVARTIEKVLDGEAVFPEGS